MFLSFRRFLFILKYPPIFVSSIFGIRVSLSTTGREKRTRDAEYAYNAVLRGVLS